MKSNIYLVLLVLIITSCTTYSEKSNLLDCKNEIGDGLANKFVGLIPTENESLEPLKWENKSFDEVIKDAYNGDRGAFYLIGVSCVMGQKGIPIEAEKANVFFSYSASLGFAPALDKLGKMYLEENNFFLLLVYQNVLIAIGHSELIEQYHHTRSEIVKLYGREIMQEVERVAASKHKAILTNQANCKKAIDKKAFIIDMISNRKEITSEDVNYGREYWLSFFQ